jgi:putative transposase
LLGIPRSSYYYQPREENPEDAVIRRVLDEQYLKTPFYGSRRMTVHLQQLGYAVNRKRVQRLMREMGLVALYPKPNLSQPHPEHRIYPDLLRGVRMNRVNQVWSTDITYLPVGKGHFYLVAIMDWFSRKVLSWGISNSLEVAFCITALEQSLQAYPLPEIFNSDQGSQFTANAFTDCLKAVGIQISMDGRGRCHDNIFIERLWWSLKYELIYIKDFLDGHHLEKEVNGWFDWYNSERPHQFLDYQTPNQVYDSGLKAVI